MMIKSSIATIVLLGLVGSAHMQGGQPSSDQQSGQGLGFGNGRQGQGSAGLLGGILGGGQGQGSAGLLGGILGGGQQQGSAGLLDGILGPGQQQGSTGLLGILGGGQQQQPGAVGGLTEYLRQLPQRSMELVSNLLHGVRNLLPLGLGRNGNQYMNRSQFSGGQMGQPMGQQMGQQMGGLDGLLGGNPLSTVNSLTQPLTNSLSQGRLPDLNQVNGNLQRTLSNVLPLGQQPQQQLQQLQ